jgi:hypothetical protein
MWVASKYGFYSIVESSLKKGDFMVRGRIKKDLENLINNYDLKYEIIKTLDSDYRYRIIMPKSAITQLLFQLGEDIDYSNFKGKIAATPDQYEKLDAYHSVWKAMNRLQKPS